MIEESRRGLSEKLSCDVLAVEGFPYPTCRTGAGVANQSFPNRGKEGDT